MTFSPIDQENIRAIVREEIALDEARRIESERSSPNCPRCVCSSGRRVPGPLLPGTQIFSAGQGDRP